MIRNLTPPSDGRVSGFWSVEWPDATGTFYSFTVWGKDEEYARARAEEFASQWATYTHDPIQSAKDVEQILHDYATRTYHGD